MKSKKYFLNKGGTLLDLLEMGMSSAFIQFYLDISYSTFLRNLRKLRAEKKWNEKVTSFTNSIPKMLIVLSYGVDMDSLIPGENYNNIDKIRLINCLKKILQIEEVISNLDCAGRSIQEMRQFEFDPKVPQGYVNFLNSLNPFNIKNPYHKYNREWRDSWKEFLDEIKNSQKVNFTIKSQKEWPGVVVNKIIKRLISEVRNDIKPIFTIDICKKLEDVLFPTLTVTEVKILKMYFGLNEPRLNLIKISESLGGLKIKRVREIITEATEKCKKLSRYRLIFDPYFKPELLEFTGHVHRLVDLHLSARTMNILESITPPIFFLEELVDYSRDNLCKFKGWGKDRMAEIDEIMGKYGLPLCK
jgi:hypothetical protein